MKKAYLAIAIANNPEWEAQLIGMEKRWQEKGFYIVSPRDTKKGIDSLYSEAWENPQPSTYLLAGLDKLETCDIIAMHESCKRLNSKGAEIERLFAEYGNIEVVWE